MPGDCPCAGPSPRLSGFELWRRLHLANAAALLVAVLKKENMPFSLTRSVTAFVGEGELDLDVEVLLHLIEELVRLGVEAAGVVEKTRKGLPVRCAYWMRATSSAPLKAMARSSPKMSSACERISIVV